eukprot:7144246-Prymnesium_polylepis.1
MRRGRDYTAVAERPHLGKTPCMRGCGYEPVAKPTPGTVYGAVGVATGHRETWFVEREREEERTAHGCSPRNWKLVASVRPNWERGMVCDAQSHGCTSHVCPVRAKLSSPKCLSLLSLVSGSGTAAASKLAAASNLADARDGAQRWTRALESGASGARKR